MPHFFPPPFWRGWFIIVAPPDLEPLYARTSAQFSSFSTAWSNDLSGNLRWLISKYRYPNA